MGVFARAPDPAMIHSKIITPHPESIARGIDFAISDHNILVIVTGKSVVPCSEITCSYSKVFTKPGMKTVMSAPY